MTAAYFEDHPTDPDKVILRKPKHEDYKKPWVGLTDEEIERRQEEFAELENMPFSKNDWLWFYTKDIEQALKKKNT
jgi:hypothetical protein